MVSALKIAIIGSGTAGLASAAYLRQEGHNPEIYERFDEPKPLGKFETGAKTAMPIFKSFIKSALKKENTRPFKVPENITMMVVDSKTGKKVSFASKKTLIESFKSNKVPEKTNISKKINNRFNNNNILRFY